MASRLLVLIQLKEILRRHSRLLHFYDNTFVSPSLRSETSFNVLHLLALRKLLNFNPEESVDDIFIALSSFSRSIPCEYRTGKES